MPSPKTASISTSTRKRTLDVDDSDNVPVNDTPISSKNALIITTPSINVSSNDCENIPVNYTPIFSKNALINATPSVNVNVLSNETPLLKNAMINVDVNGSSNETPLSPRLPHESSSALFTCSTPLSAYKTPAKKKRLFTPGNGHSQTGTPGSVYVPVSSPTDSELLKADIDNSDVFLDGSCLVSTDNSNNFLNGSCKSGSTNDNDVVLNRSCKSVLTNDSDVFLNESCKSVNSSVFLDGNCSIFTDCTPLKTIRENVPASSPPNSEVLKTGIYESDVLLDESCKSGSTDDSNVFLDGNCSTFSDCSPLKTILESNVESVNNSPVLNNIDECRPFKNSVNDALEQTSSSEEHLEDVSGIDFL